MKQRMLIETVGPADNIFDRPKEGQYVAIRLPLSDRPNTTYALPVGLIPREVLPLMTRDGARFYAQIETNPALSSPNIIGPIGFYSENEPSPIGVTDIEPAPAS